MSYNHACLQTSQVWKTLHDISWFGVPPAFIPLFVAVVPTFSTNSQENACYVG